MIEYYFIKKLNQYKKKHENKHFINKIINFKKYGNKNKKVSNLISKIIKKCKLQ